MTLNVQNCLKHVRILFHSFVSLTHFHVSSRRLSHIIPSAYSSSPSGSSQSIRARVFPQTVQSEGTVRSSELDIIVAKIHVGRSEDEIFESLLHDRACNSIKLSDALVDKLLHRFKDDWKSALGVFRWAGSRAGYKHTPKAYDIIVDTLGKRKQMDRMRAFLEEMNQLHLVRLHTVAKVMRRSAGAGQWEDAVKTFDDLGTFGLEKNTESMNLLLDTLCKENKVEQARDIFVKLKTHIAPSANTFNIFIHGWCKVNKVDEAHWTVQEMKGYGFRPCVISYSTIILFYCRQNNFDKVYELLDEMEAQGCPPNVITYTTIMCLLAKSEEFEEALQIYERMKSVGCEPDTLFYNSLIHTFGRAGQAREAIRIFEFEMPRNGVKPNTSTYNSLIAMFCHHGQEQKAFSLLAEMKNSSLCKPDVQTYYPLLKSCFRSGKTDSDLRKLLDEMANKHHLSLDISTYTLLIHGLCRTNKCEWAYNLFEEMIGQEIMPRYQTCRLLLDEVKQKNMYETADRIEDLMKTLKHPKHVKVNYEFPTPLG